MRPAARAAAAAVIAALAGAPPAPRAADAGAAATDPAGARAAMRRADAAYQGKDMAGFLREAQATFTLQPDWPAAVYNLAAAFSLNRRPADASREIRRLAGMGIYLPAEKDADFEAVRTNKEVVEAYGLLRRNLDPVVRSRGGFTFPSRGRIVESVVRDPGTGVWYAASVRPGEVLRLSDGGGEPAAFSRPGELFGSALGMRVDADRRLLWVASAELSPTPELKGEPRRSGLVRYDLESGLVAGQFGVPEDGVRHVLGDCLVRSDGAVLATDSAAPVVWWLPPRGARLEPFVRDERFLSLQGLAFTADERALIVADYSSGLWRIDVADRGVSPIATPAGATLVGIDGLWHHQGALIASQNGVTPQRVVRIPLADGARAAAVEVLDSANPACEEITLGCLVDAELFFVANSRWNRWDERTKKLDLLGPAETRILRLSLRK